MCELVKRDGRREQYDPEKLARSLLRAGLAPEALAQTVARLAPETGSRTNLLRARVESELTLRQPSAARRYAGTRTLTVQSSEYPQFGWICLNPDMVSRLGVRPGDALWLSSDGTPMPFSVVSHESVGYGRAWLNHRELAAIKVADGTRLAASGVFHEGATPFENLGFLGRGVSGRTADWSASPG